MTERYRLSRRKALAGLTTIGAAGAGAGLGTSALLRDQEALQDVVQAGSLDLSVSAEIVAHVDNEYWNGLELEAVTANGDPAVFLDVQNVLPGDWAIVRFDIAVSGNPGFVQISSRNFETNENGLTEAEREIGDTAEGGELHKEMLAELYLEFDPSNDSDPPRSHLDVNIPSVPPGTTIQQAFEGFEQGGLIRDLDRNPVAIGTGEDRDTHYLLLWLPRDVGSEVQTDSFSGTLVYDAEQARNNDAPFSN